MSLDTYLGGDNDSMIPAGVLSFYCRFSTVLCFPSNLLILSIVGFGAKSINSPQNSLPFVMGFQPGKQHFQIQKCAQQCVNSISHVSSQQKEFWQMGTAKCLEEDNPH